MISFAFLVGVICVICGLRVRLLLCNAVDCAHTPHQRFAIDAHHTAIRKQPLQYIQRSSVVRMSEDWRQHHTIGDVEIGITCRQSIEVATVSACAADNSGHR